MKSLEQIEEEVGTSTFHRWKRIAELQCNGSCFLYRPTEARQAYVYEEIMRRYDEHKKVHKEPKHE